jgi:DNA-binding MarR family transcriptional regulator
VTPPSAAVDDRAAEIVEALSPLLAQQRRRWASRCRAHGISILGFHLLALLEMHEAMAMGRLAEEIDVALPNATGVVTRMEERGFVRRHHDPGDRRTVNVELTQDGRRLIGEMEASRQERMTRLIGELDETQQRRLLRCVHDLKSAAARLPDGPEART